MPLTGQVLYQGVMPRAETNHRTGRYREHRMQLTRFCNSTDLSPKYAFFAELILLWLDCAPDQEENIWTLIMFYISNAKPPRTVRKEDFDVRAEGQDPIRDEWSKEKIREGLSVFLASEDE